MPNFAGNVAISNTRVKSGLKGILQFTGSKPSFFTRFGNVANFRNFGGAKALSNANSDGSGATPVRTVGQLFP